MTAQPVARPPQLSEVPARRLPWLAWRGARNLTVAGREFVAAADLGKGLDPTQRALIVQERRAEYAARVALARRVVGYAVVSVWCAAGIAAIAVHGWSLEAAVGQVAVAVLVASPWSNVGRRIHLQTSAKASGGTKDAAEVKAATKSLGQMATLILAQIAITWPISMALTSLVLWSWAGPVYAWALGVGAALLAVTGLGVLVAFAWRDGSVLDDLGVTVTDGPPTEGVLARAIASAVLGAKGPKVAELAGTVRFVAPGIASLPDGGWRATIELPESAVATEAVKKADRIASYLEVDAGWLVVVQGAHDGQITVTGYDHDPYEQDGDRCPLAVDPRPTSVWDPIRVGRTLTGVIVTILLAYAGVLIGGRPRVGKTVTLLDILAHVLCDPDCDVMIGDGKEVDTYAARDVATEWVGADPEAFSAMLSRLLERVDAARVELRGRGYKRLTRENAAETGLRPAVLLVDELAYYTRPVQAKHRETAEVIIDQLSRLVEYGPAFGVWVVLATQYPRGEVIDARIRQIPIRVALPTSDRIASDLILGEGSNARGHRSHLFPASTTGVAVVKADRVWTTVVDYCDAEDDLARLVAYAEGLRGGLGVLPARADTASVVESARAVFAAEGVNRLPSVVLADRLGYASPEALADVLRPLGVRPSKFRTGQGTARGYLLSAFGGVEQPRNTPRNDPGTPPEQFPPNVLAFRPRSGPVPGHVPPSSAPRLEQS